LVTPRQSPARSIRSWARKATFEGKSDYVNAHLDRYVTLIELVDTLPIRSGARVLEVGSGDGFLGEYLRQRYGWAVEGLDCIERDVELSRQRGIPSTLCDVDREALPFGDGSLDLVLFDSVLEHLYRPASAIAEVKRVIAPGGHLIVGTPHATALVSRLRVLIGENPFSRFNRFNALEGGAFMRECAVFYTPDEVAELLGPELAIERHVWCTLIDPFRAQRPAWRNWITPMRQAVCRAIPPLSDFFYLAAKKRSEK
jgi:SAM-dependent methyltransferase